MNLYINRIVIEKEGRFSESHEFSRGLSVVKSSSDLYDAVAFLSGKSKFHSVPYGLRFFAEVEIEKTYCVCAEKKENTAHWEVTVFSRDNMELCTEEYFEMVSAHKELDSLKFYKYSKKQNYSHRFQMYKNILDYYPKGEFAKRTEGVGTTRSFQGFICQYIKGFKPIRLRENKDIFIKLRKSGVFVPRYIDSEEKVFLSESEETVFNYLCFLSLADFWRRCERIRNINCIDTPLVICDLVERIDESYDLSPILKRTDQIDRQSILFVPKNYKKTEYDL